MLFFCLFAFCTRVISDYSQRKKTWLNSLRDTCNRKFQHNFTTIIYLGFNLSMSPCPGDKPNTRDQQAAIWLPDRLSGLLWTVTLTLVTHFLFYIWEHWVGHVMWWLPGKSRTRLPGTELLLVLTIHPLTMVNIFIQSSPRTISGLMFLLYPRPHLTQSRFWISLGQCCWKWPVVDVSLFNSTGFATSMRSEHFINVTLVCQH